MENEPALPLGRRNEIVSTSAFASDVNIAQVLKCLGLVLGLFLGFVWLLRRFQTATQAVDSELFQVLGEFPLVGRQRAVVVQFMNHLLLLSDSPKGMQTILEIRDPAEIDQLRAVCAQRSSRRTRRSRHDRLAGRKICDVLADDPTDSPEAYARNRHTPIVKATAAAIPNSTSYC